MEGLEDGWRQAIVFYECYGVMQEDRRGADEREEADAHDGVDGEAADRRQRDRAEP